LTGHSASVILDKARCENQGDERKERRKKNEKKSGSLEPQRHSSSGTRHQKMKTLLRRYQCHQRRTLSKLGGSCLCHHSATIFLTR